MRLQLAYAPCDKEAALKVLSELKKLGYDVLLVKDKPLYPEEVILALFTEDTDREEFLKALPWLKEQKDYSSLKYLRVMPFFVYSSKKTDPEEAFEGNPGELYEDIFSGEFKPYGWDLDRKDPEVEFKRVLSDYEE